MHKKLVDRLANIELEKFLSECYYINKEIDNLLTINHFSNHLCFCTIFHIKFVHK